MALFEDTSPRELKDLLRHIHQREAADLVSEREAA